MKIMRTGASKHFRDTIRHYVREGDSVAELYHGERDDILRGLAEIVGEEGQVYGVDQLNPFERHQNMRDIQNFSNAKLLKSTIPPLPIEDLDAVIIREFIWTYPLPFNGSEDPEVYQAIDAALKTRGHLLLHLNKTEQKSERTEYPLYQITIARQLPNFQRVHDKKDLMVYQKNKR